MGIGSASERIKAKDSDLLFSVVVSRQNALPFALEFNGFRGAKGVSTTGIKSIVEQGSKVWLDSVDPDLITDAIENGATGATSNPIIIADLIKSGRFDASLKRHQSSSTAEEIAWLLTDELVTKAEKAFLPIWEQTSGDDGYVSFELDPLLEDYSDGQRVDQSTDSYISLGKKWAMNHPNRLIKIPATEAGIAALEELAAAGVNINVTLIFSPRQYEESRDAIWRGAQRRGDLKQFKSVYSIFVSRVDVYTKSQILDLSSEAQGQVALLNAKQICQANKSFWEKHQTPLKQEMVFASTGTKDPAMPADYYVSALVGSDIQTNPPATNEAVDRSGESYQPTIDAMPKQEIQNEIAEKVDMRALEHHLMKEGVDKFCAPQKQLLTLIARHIK